MNAVWLSKHVFASDTVQVEISSSSGTLVRFLADDVYVVPSASRVIISPKSENDDDGMCQGQWDTEVSQRMSGLGWLRTGLGVGARLGSEDRRDARCP
ncbi:MAG: hypothetical protein V3V08_22990, partial [Nannocystaceae bacterium]